MSIFNQQCRNHGMFPVNRKFCPLQHGIVLKALGEAVDELGIRTRLSSAVTSVVRCCPGISLRWTAPKLIMDVPLR